MQLFEVWGNGMHRLAFVEAIVFGRRRSTERAVVELARAILKIS